LVFEAALERGRRMRLEEVIELVDRLQDGAPEQAGV